MKAAHEDLAQLQKSFQTAQDLAKIFQELEQAKERYRLEIEEGAQGQAEAKVHLEELQFAQGLQETIRTLKQYRKQLMQLEQDLEIAQEALSEKQQAFEDVKAKKRNSQFNLRIFFKKKRSLKLGKRILSMPRVLPKNRRKSNVQRLTTSSWKRPISRLEKRLRCLTSPCLTWRLIVLV